MIYTREVGEGNRVPFIVDDTKIIFGTEGNFFTVDVAELQSDTQTIFDVMQDNDGKLGTEGNWYAATITVPPKRYKMVEDTENVVVNENGEKELSLKPVALPLDMGAVEVILYPLGKSLESELIEEAE